MPGQDVIGDSLMTMGSHGLTDEQTAWIRENMEHPAFDRFATLARASFLEFPFTDEQDLQSDTLEFYQLSIPKYSAFREISYWKAYRAAAFVSRRCRTSTNRRDPHKLNLHYEPRNAMPPDHAMLRRRMPQASPCTASS